MNEEGAPFDSGFDDAGPFSVTPEADGVALDAALRQFGPAAFDDLLPRLRAIAADLDAAHTEGFIHGRLHPSKVFVTDDGTYLLGARVPLSFEPASAAGDGGRQWPIQPPYTAPEVIKGGIPGPSADQYSLAAIAYEWMFGRPIAGPAERNVDVRAIPNVDRTQLVKAFTRALAPEPFRRFASCTDFCDAIVGASAPALPLLSAAADDADEHLEPFMPEDRPAPIEPAVEEVPAPIHDLSFAADEPHAPAAEPDLDSFEPVNEPVPSAFASAEPAYSGARTDGVRFGGFALILATLVGALFGFAAGYMARPRALQSPPPQAAAGAAGNEIESGAAAPVPAPGSTEASRTPTPEPDVPSPKAPPAAEKVGRLLVRSSPAGATVDVDGVPRGVTPLALRDLDLGTREITVSRSGYAPESRRIVLTEARPSRSVDVRLSAPAAGRTTTPPRPSTPASPGKPAATTGVLAVESRPTGASVLLNGKPSGTTPVTISDLAPGEYSVTLALQGHRPVTTTVRVVAGERARAAARLTEQQQEQE